MAGAPTVEKTVDAWDPGGAKPYLVYNGAKSPFKALPIRFIRLQVGDRVKIEPVGPKDTKTVFTLSLKRENYEVKAEMLDAEKRVIAGGYYVYCGKV